MDSSIPPRPDFFRRRWLSLDGFWSFMFDDEDRGLGERWFEAGLPNPVDIRVPYPYQSRLSGIGDESLHPVVWYARRFELPEAFRGGRVFLRFGAVDYRASIWVNGRLIGEHVGGYSPFGFDVTGALRDENLLVLRVEDRHGDQARGKQDQRVKPSGCLYMRVTGIWQPVWLEGCGEAWVEGFQAFPCVDKRGVRLRVHLSGRLAGSSLKVEVLLAGAGLVSLAEKVRDETVDVFLKLPEVALWSPEEPDIYAVEFTLERNGEAVDSVRGYFGLREVSVKDGRILLNGKPLYLKFALDQGYFPEGLYAAPSPEALKRDVEAVKKLGLNGVRKHQKPEDPRYFYWCDKLGVLVWEEMPDWGMSLRLENLEPFWSEVESIVKRDFNHPSIIAWVPFNERREVRDNADSRRFVVEVCSRIKSLDPTRLLVDNSGYVHTPATDIVDIHDYSGWMGYRHFKERLVKTIRCVKTGEPKDFSITVDDFAYEGQPIVVSEWGGWGIEGYKPLVDREVMVYGPPVADELEFLTRYRACIKAITEHRDIVGFCYTQLYDIEGELNGYMTYDRRWKINPQEIARIHSTIERLNP